MSLFRPRLTALLKKSCSISTGKQRETRIKTGTPTEFEFCNRRFGAVIIDASESGMKLSCEIRLGVGSIIHLVSPSISGRIVWRDDVNKLMGIEFVDKSVKDRSS